MSQPLPLSGVQVLDISTFIAAPSAAVVLGDYGADVIKLEQPGSGDPNRHARNFAAYPNSAVNYPWLMDARNKRSVALDLKHPDARAVLHELVRRTDVLITNMPHLVRGRLGIDYDDLAGINERLIYASLTGYGESGPDRDQPGFDANAYYARTGYLDALKYEGGPPHFQLPASGDRASAMSLVCAIMMALYQREKTGRGTEVGASLIGAGLWSNGVYAQAALVDSYLEPRPPRDRPRSALSNSYQTRDGRWLLLALAREEAGWPGLCHAIGKSSWLDEPRYRTTADRTTHRIELTRALDEVFGAHDLAYWQACLARHRVIFSVVQRLQDIRQDPQVYAAGAIVETDIEEMPLTIAAPIRIRDVTPRRAQRAPELGEHTDAVLHEIGLDAGRIDELERQGVIAKPARHST